MRKVYILGTGGLARETAQIVNLLHLNHKMGKFSGYISHDSNEIGNILLHGEVVGTDELILSMTNNIDLVIGVGHPSLRKKLALKYANSKNISFPNVIHPSATIDLSDNEMGIGNIIANGAFVSCQVKVGDFNLINWNSTIGHDVKIGSCCVINPGAHVSGFVTIKDTVLLGAGSIVLENLNVCENAKIGAGAVVTKNITKPASYIGVPAREMINK